MGVLLLLETATEICSVAISRDRQIIAHKETSEQYKHSAELTTLIEQCLAEAAIDLNDLNAIALSSGPGSYTALRVGSSTAKGLCYALNIPLIAIDTLQSLAYATSNSVEDENALYCPMIDARRMEVYTALFDFQYQAVTEVAPMIVDSTTFQTYFEQGRAIIFSGNGASKCQSVITSTLARFAPIVCNAKHLITLAHDAFEQQQFVDTAYFKPEYGKAPNITIPKKRL